MVSINIRIEHDATKDKDNNPYLQVSVDLLKREDADDMEWRIAKTFEETMKFVLKRMSEETLFTFEI
jgi:hypothetical protein